MKRFVGKQTRFVGPYFPANLSREKRLILYSLYVCCVCVCVCVCVCSLSHRGYLQQTNKPPRTSKTRLQKTRAGVPIYHQTAGTPRLGFRVPRSLGEIRRFRGLFGDFRGQKVVRESWYSRGVVME